MQFRLEKSFCRVTVDVSRFWCQKFQSMTEGSCSSRLLEPSLIARVVAASDTQLLLVESVVLHSRGSGDSMLLIGTSCCKCASTA